MNTDEIKRLCMDAFMEGMMESSRLGSWNHAFEEWWESKRPKVKYFKANHVQGLYAKLQAGVADFANLARPEWECGIDGAILADGYTEIDTSELPPEIKP